MVDEGPERFVEQVIKRRLESPRSYSLDGESITNDTPDELAKLVNMYRKASADPQGRKAPFKISVCRNNATY